MQKLLFVTPLTESLTLSAVNQLQVQPTIPSLLLLTSLALSPLLVYNLYLKSLNCSQTSPAPWQRDWQSYTTLVNIRLEYWRTGLFYTDPDIFFCIESLLGSSQFQKEETKDGVLIVASPNSRGKKIIGQLVDLVISLVNEWYPGLTEYPHGGTSSLEQKVPCYECLKQGRLKPFKFKVEQCLPKIAMNQMTIECGYFRDDPAKNHIVSLADIVPDLRISILTSFLMLKTSATLKIDPHYLGKVVMGRSTEATTWANQ